MSQENVDVVLRSLEHRLAGRLDDWVATFQPDISWDISAYPLVDFPDIGSGRDAFVGHMLDYFAGWTDYQGTIDELRDAGDDVVVILHERARMGRSDAILERQLAMVWTVGDRGAIGFLRVFKTRVQALKAVGLAE